MPSKISINRLEDPVDRDAALRVLRATYQAEKGWVREAESQIADSDLGSEQVFMASCSARAGASTMILDLKAAYQRLQRRRGWIFRALTADWDEGLHQRLAA